jgi:coenzyme F420 hydrogenase subunit beta
MGNWINFWISAVALIGKGEAINTKCTVYWHRKMVVKSLKLKNVIGVAEWRLCVGCGACHAICPEGNIQLVDVMGEGIRPILDADDCKFCGTCLKGCPGLHGSAGINHVMGHALGTEVRKRWGNVEELWEGYAADPEIRFKGSSGGLCTALSIYCVDKGLAGGVVHIGADPEAPLKNKTFRSTTPQELIERTGSRYSPASPCDSLKLIEEAVEPSVFIGKPCDVGGLRLVQGLRPVLAQKTALAIGFFCAGTPATQGTLELLRTHSVDPASVCAFRFRGMGWPGMARAHFKNPSAKPFELSYQQSWGFINRYRPFRCHLCPDLTAEAADISVGDPWYREVGDDEPGQSLILIRTERGQEVFHQAMKHGCVIAQKCAPNVILKSQHNLLTKRQAIWGRLLAMRFFAIPRPELSGFHLFENWQDLSVKEKAKSFLGTAKRIIQRKYYRPREYQCSNRKRREA